MINGSSTQITYIIPMETGMNEKSFSPFSGFSEEFIDKSYFLSLISKLPQDISELSSASYRNIAVRQVVGDYKILIVNSAMLFKIPQQFFTPFVCIFTSNETQQETKDFITSLPFNPIHVSEIRTNNSIYPNELTRKKMRKEFKSVAKQLYGHIDKEEARILNKLLSGRPKTLRSSEFTLNSRLHNIVKPSECALVAHRYKFKRSVHLMEGGKDSYIQGVVDASRAILSVRKMVEPQFSKSKNDFILALPSFYAFFYKNKSFTNELYKAEGKIARKFFEKHLLRYTGYVASDVTQEEFLEGSNNRLIQSLIQERQKELFAFTNVMSILSSEDFVPFIRLPNGLNLLHSHLDTIESLICGVAKRRKEKLNREFSRLNDLMLKVVPDDVLKLISDCGEKGIIVSDYPIEWMCLDNDLPLLFTKELCRIGSNPGNVLSDLVCNTEHVEFEISSVKQILVLRSFNDDDPIRNSLENAVHVFSKNFTNNTEVLFVDVNSEEELCNALNKYRPFLAVFDCHGNHGGRNEHAWLNIGNERVDVWKLKGRCHVPVIAVLSACSTHPVAGSHASVANGLLASGVAGVIATSVPIPALEAAAFVARLIYRIDTFLPLQLNSLDSRVCWREFINKMFRMSYSTDILRAYRDDKPQWITESQYVQIHQSINMEINCGNPNWHYVLFEQLVRASGKTLEDIKNRFIRSIRFKHSAFYVQMGRSDKIFIIQK